MNKFPILLMLISVILAIDAKAELGSMNALGEVWQKVEGISPEIYVQTNGIYYDRANYSEIGFHTHIVSNLPESDIVGAPQSVIVDVEGKCAARTFHILGKLYYAGKNRSGMPIQSTEPEQVVRKLTPNSPFEAAFNVLCKNNLAKE